MERVCPFTVANAKNSVFDPGKIRINGGGEPINELARVVGRKPLI